MPQLDIVTPSTPVTRTAARFLRVLPLAFVTYSLAYLDRVNYGYAEAGGMAKTLHLGEQVTALMPAIFFVGYFLFQIPGAAYAAHRSARRLIFWTLLAWGLLSALTGVIRNVPLLIADRILLGVVEGVVFPAMLVFLTHWFTRRERSRANTLLILGNPLTMAWASVVSGSAIAFFDGLHARGRLGLRGWQMMFIIEGVPSMLWAFGWLILAADRPADANWLTPDEAAAVQDALDREQRDVPPVKDYWAAFADWRVRTLSLQFFFWSVGIYGFVLWLPKIVSVGSKQGIGTVGLLTAIPYCCGSVAMLAVSWVSDRTLWRKVFVWPSLLLGGIAFAASYLAGPAHFWPAFAGLVLAGVCMYAPYGPYWAMLPEMVPRNVVGESMALVNSAGALGGFFGTYGVGYLITHTGRTDAAFTFMAACLILSAGLTVLVRTSIAAASARRV